MEEEAHIFENPAILTKSVDSFENHQISSYQNRVSVSPKAQLTQRFLDYQALPEDWDGYGGVAPTKQTTNDAIKFIEALPKHLPLPKSMVGRNGIVGLYWKNPDVYAEVCFEGDGTFWYYVEDAKGNEAGEDVVYLKVEREKLLP